MHARLSLGDACLRLSQLLSAYTHNALPMNLRFVKLSHHYPSCQKRQSSRSDIRGRLALLGVLPSAYILFSNRTASSCLICVMYCRRSSASFLSRGGSNAWFSGNVASPGMAKLVSSAVFMTACPWSASVCFLPSLVHGGMAHGVRIAPGARRYCLSYLTDLFRIPPSHRWLDLT